ncbi:MAG: universal stress protein [Saprospiraceae bacterium]|nr:universal stress protein [Saprospiraceae bacterium]
MIRFKVYGIDQQQELKSMIMEWMNESNMPYDVESIVDVDQFIKEGINSIPTIVIQTEVKLEQRQYKDIETFSKAIRKITSKMSSIVTNKIIVPTDFSKTAENATRYAIEIAKQLGGTVELVHVLNPATDLNTGYMIDPGIETVKRNKLQQIAEETSKESGVSIGSKFILGFPIEELTRLSEDQEVLLVVGATGESDILENVFGSVASHLARRSKAPVLIVPKGATFSPFKEVVYASNDASMDYRISSLVKNFVSLYDSRLHCVHIGDDDQYPEWQMDAIFGEAEGTPRLKKEHLREANVVEGLNHYCETEDADLLIMTTQERNFWRTIVHTSVTKEMALHPHLPLLVLHDERK